MDVKKIKEFVLSYIDENKEEILKIEHDIWEHPELGMEEYHAVELHKKYLSGKGFNIEDNVAGMPTAFVATWGEGNPVIGFSMEYDALPGLSQKVQTKKEPVVYGAPGQGCGHNLIGCGGALTAAAVKAAAEEFNLKCTLKVFGTPAEELCIGKPVMGNAGVFEGLDAVLDWHPLSFTAGNPMESPAYFNVKFHYKGRTSHGNAPWHGRSALDAAMLQAHAIEFMREHIEPGPDPTLAHTINYTFSDTGPEFASVVPDRATLWCIGRFTKGEMIEDVIRRLDDTAKGAALMTDTEVETEYITASHEMIYNETLSDVVYNNLIEQGDVVFTEEEKQFVLDMQKEEGQEPYWEDEIQEHKIAMIPVTDSSEYSWTAPYALLQVNLGPGPGWHNWMVCACNGNTHGEKALLKAAEVLAASAIDCIVNPEILSSAKEEWSKKMEGRKYGSLLPEGAKIPLDINKEAMAKYRNW